MRSGAQGVLVGVVAVAANASAWASMLETVDEVCKACPDRVAKLFGRLDLERPDLAAVKLAVAAKDWPAACEALLDHYRSGETAKWLRTPAVKRGGKIDPRAEHILQDRITCYEITAKVPRLPGGGLNWAYNGPDGDREWGWGLNRHYHLGALLGAYRRTGNPRYVQCLDRHLQDWTRSNPYSGKKSSTPQWRGLEVFSRICRWASIFYGLQHDAGLKPATRILMLASLPEHAHYQRHFHAGGGNWVTMEMCGLATAGVCWPEFKDAPAWIDYAATRLTPELARQVYPDGVQMELTSSYHSVALYSFERFANVLRQAGRQVPDAFHGPLERMVNYTTYALRPDGNGPLNNDSDLSHNRPRVLRAAKTYSRPDWTFIATNGKQGTQPKGLPSVVFPYAGQVVMRSGWDADAHWAFFDIGPLGIGHWHFDKLHLSASAFGRDLLVDSGRYTYKGGAWRNHFVGSASHNVILVDGKHQNPEVRAVTEPMSGNYAFRTAFDFARGTFDKGFRDLKGRATHTRSVVYVRGQYWLVVDRIATDAPRTIQPLWHFHPDCTVDLDNQAVATNDAGKGNLRIVPVGKVQWQVKLVRGQVEPDIQGWYSERYNIKVPATAAVYTAKIDRDTVFGWLLVPAKGPVPDTTVKLLAADDKVFRLEVHVGDSKPTRIAIPSTGTEVSVAPSAN